MREIKLEFDVNDQVSFTTDLVEGYLDSIILDSDKKISILVESEIGYMIFKRAEFIGTQNICIRNRTTTPDLNYADFHDYEKFLLNEKIIFTIIGPKNTKVKIIFRID